MGTFYRSGHELGLALKKGDEAHTNTFELGQHGRHRTNVLFCKEYGVDLLAGQRQAIEEALAPSHDAILAAYLARNGGMQADPAAERVVARLNCWMTMLRPLLPPKP